MDSVLETLAHENWHSYQNDVMRRVRNGEAASEGIKELAELYEYNNKSYIEADLDHKRYCEQLLEAEARFFEVLVHMKITKIKDREQKEADFRSEHAEVYGEENLPGIEKEVDSALHGMDVEEFVKKAGANSLDEMWDMEENDEKVKKYVEAVSELAGLRRKLEVESVEVDESVGEVIVEVDHATSKARVLWPKGERSVDLLMRKLNRAVWGCRQREKVRYEPENERSKLYKFNFKHFVKANGRNDEEYGRQLLVREREMFADDLMDILDEQATEEYIAGLSPEEYAEAEKEREEAGWRPVVSEKYGVRSKYAREN